MPQDIAIPLGMTGSPLQIDPQEAINFLQGGQIRQLQAQGQQVQEQIGGTVQVIGTVLTGIAAVKSLLANGKRLTDIKDVISSSADSDLITVAKGTRDSLQADLLNALGDLGKLQQVVGSMTGGQWAQFNNGAFSSREQFQFMLYQQQQRMQTWLLIGGALLVFVALSKDENGDSWFSNWFNT